MMIFRSGVVCVWVVGYLCNCRVEWYEVGRRGVVML
jgi:hypothetical protein